jgi:hypothetical protein
MTEDDRAALAFARGWVRRYPGPDAWSNLAAVHATKQPANLKLARKWYRRAALKGHDRGLFEYGLMLIQGEGGPKRPAQGRRYLERAAAIGQLDALKVLAAALTKGGYSYRPSPSRAKSVNKALQRALSRQRAPNAAAKGTHPIAGATSVIPKVGATAGARHLNRGLSARQPGISRQQATDVPIMKSRTATPKEVVLFAYNAAIHGRFAEASAVVGPDLRNRLAKTHDAVVATAERLRALEHRRGKLAARDRKALGALIRSIRILESLQVHSREFMNGLWRELVQGRSVLNAEATRQVIRGARARVYLRLTLDDGSTIRDSENLLLRRGRWRLG